MSFCVTFFSVAPFAPLLKYTCYMCNRQGAHKSHRISSSLCSHDNALLYLNWYLHFMLIWPWCILSYVWWEAIKPFWIWIWKYGCNIELVIKLDTLSTSCEIVVRLMASEHDKANLTAICRQYKKRSYRNDNIRIIVVTHQISGKCQTKFVPRQSLWIHLRAQSSLNISKAFATQNVGNIFTIATNAKLLNF